MNKFFLVALLACLPARAALAEEAKAPPKKAAKAPPKKEEKKRADPDPDYKPSTVSGTF